MFICFDDRLNTTSMVSSQQSNSILVSNHSAPSSCRYDGLRHLCFMHVLSILVIASLEHVKPEGQESASMTSLQCAISESGHQADDVLIRTASFSQNSSSWMGRMPCLPPRCIDFDENASTLSILPSLCMARNGADDNSRVGCDHKQTAIGFSLSWLPSHHLSSDVCNIVVLV